MHLTLQWEKVKINTSNLPATQKQLLYYNYSAFFEDFFLTKESNDFRFKIMKDPITECDKPVLNKKNL